MTSDTPNSPPARSGSIPRRFASHLLLGLAALGFTAVWLYKMDSEYHANGFSSVVQITRATGIRPFVWRRFVFDVADAVARVAPPAAWDACRWFLEETRVGALVANHAPIRSWPREEYPLLIAVSALTWLSYWGFMVCGRRALAMFYESPAWFADLFAITLGFLILGSISDGHYQIYPYDVPHAFLFSLSALLVFSRSWWFFPLFVAAAYSKETAVLLIPLYWLTNHGRVSTRRLLVGAAALAVSYAATRAWILQRFPGESSVWFLADRNLEWILRSILFDSWSVLVALLALLAATRTWGSLPLAFRHWILLLPISLGLCLFGGWIEERRAFLEFLLPVGAWMIQSLLCETGLGWLMRPRIAPDQGRNRAETPALASPADVAAWTDRVYPLQTGLDGVLLRWRPYICPFHLLLPHVSQGRRLLDVGCGNGVFSNLAVATGRAQSCLGFDVRESAIRTARSAVVPKREAKREFLTVGLSDWPEGRHDVVACVDVVHHVPPTLQESFVQRVCQSVDFRGKLILKEMAPRPLWTAWANRLHDLVLARQWVHYVEKEDVERWVRESGLTVVETGSIRMLWYWHYFVIAVRSGEESLPDAARQAERAVAARP